MRVFSHPQDERAFGVGDGRGGIGRTGSVGEAVVDEALGITEIGGEKEVEGRAVFDFGGEHGRGLVRNFGRYASGLLKLFEDGRKNRLEIGGGGYAQWSLRGQRRGQHTRENCGEKRFGHARKEAFVEVRLKHYDPAGAKAPNHLIAIFGTTEVVP